SFQPMNRLATHHIPGKDINERSLPVLKQGEPLSHGLRITLNACQDCKNGSVAPDDHCVLAQYKGLTPSGALRSSPHSR
ncbi:hypothetical protein HAX54_049675, partial [Datura stramonium]|nr:hypothetical protein [Datura stramonium]